MPDKELVEAWREAAIAKNPGSERLAEMVAGSTREEIFASAEAAAQRVQEIAGGGSGDSFDSVRQQAEDLYGRGPTTGSSTSGFPAFPGSTPDQREIREQLKFVEKFNNAPRDAYGQRMGITHTKQPRTRPRDLLARSKTRCACGPR